VKLTITELALCSPDEAKRQMKMPDLVKVKLSIPDIELEYTVQPCGYFDWRVDLSPLHIASAFKARRGPCVGVSKIISRIDEVVTAWGVDRFNADCPCLDMHYENRGLFPPWKYKRTISPEAGQRASCPVDANPVPPADFDIMSKLRKDIEHAINCNSAENGSDTPDFILAEYLTNCLAAYDKAVTAREKWYGREPVPVDAPSVLSNDLALVERFGVGRTIWRWSNITWVAPSKPPVCFMQRAKK